MRAMDVRDADGIPYGVVPGNHDEDPLYETNFGVGRFCTAYPAGCRPFYGDGYPSGSNQSSYTLFSAGGMDFIVINLDYTNTAAGILDWADARLKEYSTRRAIVITHELVGTGYPAAFSSWGQAVFDALNDNPNVFLMMGGHTAGEGQRTDTGTNGNIIYSLLADYQTRPNGGNGWLRILEFVPADNEINVKTYSPYLSSNETDADSEFTLTYEMSSSFEGIGVATGVASGDNAAVPWPGLSPLTEYEWYVTVSDEVGSTTGPTWTLRLMSRLHHYPPEMSSFRAFRPGILLESSWSCSTRRIGQSRWRM